MRIRIPDYVMSVIDELHNNGYEVYVVGGSIRDYFLGRNPHDWDLCTSATPDESYKLFVDKPNTMITTAGISHGTIKIWIDDNEPIDVTMFGYNPRYVTDIEINKYYNKTIIDDLSRRDFTMNAIAYSPYDGIVDVYSGVNDIRKKRIRFINKPMIAVEADPFLILRAVRQAITLGFDIEPEGVKAITDIHNLSKMRVEVSGWRKGNELKKILSVANPVSYYFHIFVSRIFEKLVDCQPISNINYLLSDNNLYNRISKMFTNVYNSEHLESILSYFEYDDYEISEIMRCYNEQCS